MICAVTPRERVLRGVLSIVIAAFAVSSWGTWAVAPAAICAVLLLVGAITGWCPTNLFTAQRATGQTEAEAEAEAERFAFAVAPEPVRVRRR